MATSAQRANRFLKAGGDAETPADVRERHFRIISELGSDYGYSFRITGDGAVVFEWVTGAFARITGYSLREAGGRGHGWELVHPDDRPLALARLRRLLEGIPDITEYRIITKAGDVRWLRDHAQPEWDAAHRRVVRIYGAAQDVTDRRRAEDELRRLTARVEQQAAMLEAILSASPDHIHLIDRQGHFLYASLAAARALGLDRRDIVGKTSADLGLPAAEVAAAVGAREAVFTSGQPISGVTTLPTVDGRRHFAYTLSPVRRPDGSVEAVVATGRDVTEERRAQQRTALLLAVAREISGTLDLDQIFPQVLRRVTEALSCQGAAVFHTDALVKETRLLAQHGIPDELLPAARALRFAPHQPFDGRLARGELVVLRDIVAPGWLPADFQERFHLRTLAAAPLQVRGRGLGALVAFHRQDGRDFTPDHAELLRGIADQLAMAMESAALYQIQQEDAAVAAALARVGREMIARLDTPALLHRLCELTTEMLGCDFSHIWLWQPAEGAYVPTSAHGDPEEHWEALRTLRLSPDLIGPLLEQLRRDGVANTRMDDLGDAPLARLPSIYGITATLVLALQRGGEIVGLYTAGYRGQRGPFDARQIRIAQGVAQLGSLALESARLVEELEHANRLKSDFLATMSHELRTPLNIIIGYTDLLLSGSFDPLTPPQADTLARVEKSARELLELIAATLNLSRLESGRESLELCDVAVADFVRALEAEVREACTSKPQVGFAWRIDDALPALHTDPLKLKVVLKNLIHNAVKFTERGGIVVQVESRAGGVEFSVADTGIGIAAAAQRLIFDAFRQVDSSSTRRHGGVGLGLYIVRRLTEMLGGTVAVHSELGRGSTFRVWLPTDGPAVQSVAAPSDAAGGP